MFQAGKQAGKNTGRQASTRKAFSRSHPLEGLVFGIKVYNKLVLFTLRLWILLTTQLQGQSQIPEPELLLSHLSDTLLVVFSKLIALSALWGSVSDDAYAVD